MSDAVKPGGRTVTLPESKGGPVSAITSLRVDGTRTEFPLPPAEKYLALGTDPAGHIVLNDPAVSAYHLSIERTPTSLVIRDQRSKNGVKVEGVVVPKADILPGWTFTVGETTLYALTDGMRRARPHIEVAISTLDVDQHLVDNALKRAGKNENITIVGPRGSGARDLSSALHEASPIGGAPMLELTKLPPDIDGMKTLVKAAAQRRIRIDLTSIGRAIPSTFLALLFAPSYHARVVFLAESLAQAHGWVQQEYAGQCFNVPLQSLERRVVLGELEAIADRWLVLRPIRDEGGSVVRASDIGQGVLSALAKGSTYDELREVVVYLAGLMVGMKQEDAAKLAGAKRSTLNDRLNRAGVDVDTLIRRRRRR